MQQTAGRIKSDTTVRRELRRSLNSAAASLADGVNTPLAVELRKLSATCL